MKIPAKDSHNFEIHIIKLRYQGKDSIYIAQATGLNESYVRRLFMKDGRLAGAYQEFIAHQNELLQQVVSAALAKAKEIGLEAIERMVGFSRDEADRRLGYEATKFILTIIGISNESSLKNILKPMSYETAAKKVNEIFKELYGVPANGPDIRIFITSRDGSTKAHEEVKKIKEELGS